MHCAQLLVSLSKIESENGMLFKFPRMGYSEEGGRRGRGTTVTSRASAHRLDPQSCSHSQSHGVTAEWQESDSSMPLGLCQTRKSQMAASISLSWYIATGDWCELTTRSRDSGNAFRRL